MQQRDVEANGFTFRVRTAGDRHHPAVLLLHGFPETGFMWERLMPALAQAGYFAIAPDQRGTSPLARPEGVEHYRIDRFVEDALAVARALGVERFHLVGHDSGGTVAWRLAAFHPRKVVSLTAMSVSHPERSFPLKSWIVRSGTTASPAAAAATAGARMAKMCGSMVRRS